MKTVFFGSSHSIALAMYKDVYDAQNVEYCVFNIEQLQKGFLRHGLFLGRKGRYFPFVVKDVIYKKVLRYDFLKQSVEEYLFVFTCQFGMSFECQFITFVNYLKKKYKRSKFVFYFNDIIQRFPTGVAEEIKNNFDMVLTFDKRDAAQYCLDYYGLVHSKNFLNENDDVCESDIFYVGGDAGRFDQIFGAFKRLAEAGKKCVFFIVGVLQCNQEKLSAFIADCKKQGSAYQYKNSLLYVNHLLNYKESLKYIYGTKCMFEVLLPEQTAGTLRLAESVMYGKKLITNCKVVKEMPFYKAENIFVFDKPEKIDVKFLDSPYVPVEYDFSPLKMIEYAKNKLYKEEII